MRKPLILAAALALTLAACSDEEDPISDESPASETVEEDDGEAEDAGNGDEEAAAEEAAAEEGAPEPGGDEGVETPDPDPEPGIIEDDEGESPPNPGELPDAWPADLPLPAHPTAEVVMSTNFTEPDGEFLDVLVSADISFDEVQAYLDDLAAAGIDIDITDDRTDSEPASLFAEISGDNWDGFISVVDVEVISLAFAITIPN